MELTFANRYKFIKLLGKGTFGEVYSVLDKRDEKIIALKFTDLFRENLIEEFSLLTRLRHPYLVRVYECGVWEDRFYFTMEYIEGVDILTYSMGKKTEDILPLIKQLLAGLDYLHSRGLVHGDIKPSNILVEKNMLKILDFSLTSESFSRGEIKGTIGYIPPEVIEEKVFTPQSDLYSVGVLLYEIFTGRLPFTANTLNELYKKQIEKCFTPIRNINTDVSKKIQDTISKLLEPIPQDRFPNAKQVIKFLFPNYRMERSISLPFVGRKAMLRKMERFVEKRMEKGFNAPSTILVYGEKGIGKTALIKEFAKRLSLKGIKVLMEVETTTSPPLYFLVKEFCMMGSPDLLDRYSDKITKFYPDLSLFFKNKNFSTVTPPDFKNIIYFINEIISERKEFFIILIDDLHNSLPEGIEIFNFLSENLNERAIIFATVNPDLLKKSIKIHGKKTILSGLTREEVKKVILLNFGNMALIDEMVEKTFKFTSGNPLLIQEILNTYIRNGIIKEMDGVYQIDIQKFKDYNVSFPKDLGAIFKQRLEELDKHTLDFLSFLSVIGDDFPSTLVLALNKKKELLKKAMEYSILTEKSGKIQFSHPVLRNLLYQSLDSEKRKSLHKKIGKVLEESYPSMVEQILFHYLEADDEEGIRRISPMILKIENPRILNLLLKSLPYVKDRGVKKNIIIRIAQIFHLIGNFTESSKFYKRALNLEKNKKEKAKILYQLGFLSVTTRELKNALINYKKALELLPDKKDTLYGKIIAGLGVIYSMMAKSEDALRLLNEALRISQLKNDIKTEAKILLNIAITNFSLGNVQRAIETTKAAAKMAKSIKDNILLSSVYINLGAFYYYKTDYTRAMKWLKKSLILKEKVGDLANIQKILLNMGLILAERGEYAEARSLFKRGKLLSPKNVSLKSRFLHNTGYLSYLIGSYSQAEKEIQKSLEIDQKTANKLFLPQTYRNLSLIFLDRGNYQKAIANVNEGLRVARDLKNNAWESELLSVFMNIYYSIGAFKKAYEIAETLLKREVDGATKSNALRVCGDLERSLSTMENTVAEDIDGKRARALFYFSISNEYLNAGEIEKAEKYWQVGNKIANSIGQRLPSAISLYLQGRILYERRGLLGPEHAIHYFEKAKKHFDKMKIGEYQWRTDYWLGKCKLLLGEKNEAITLFEGAIKRIEKIESSIVSSELKKDFYSHPERKEFLKFIEEL